MESVSTPYEQWLRDLKPGDEIAYRMEYGKRWIIVKVSKRTPKGWIITDGGSTFFSDGKPRSGDSYSGPSRCEPVTDKVRNDILRTTISGKMHRVRWDDIPLESLKKIADILHLG